MEFDPLELLTVRQVCALTKFSRGTIYELVRSDRLHATRINHGGALRIARFELERYLREATGADPAAPAAPTPRSVA